MKILVCDDAGSNRIMLAKLLTKLGHDVIACENGEQVLEVLRKGELPCLVFLDWEMPGISGLEVCRKIRETRAEPYTHIVLLTGRSESSDVVEGIRAGASDYLMKPISADEFQQRLGSAIQMIELNQTLASHRLNQIKSYKFVAVGRMAAGVAHSVSEPLIAIMQASNDALEAIDLHDFERARKDNQIIADAALEIGRLMRSLGVAEMNSSDAKNNRESIALAALIESVVGSYRHRINDLGIELRQGPVDRMLEVTGNMFELSQALMNLIDNSIIAARDSERKWIRIEARGDNSSVQIQISESGPGIAEENLNRLFEPFFTTRTAGDGSGLGLSITRDILKAHGGGIKYVKESDSTCFEVTLPRNLAAKATDRKAA